MDKLTLHVLAGNRVNVMHCLPRRIAPDDYRCVAHATCVVDLLAKTKPDTQATILDTCVQLARVSAQGKTCRWCRHPLLMRPHDLLAKPKRARLAKSVGAENLFDVYQAAAADILRQYMENSPLPSIWHSHSADAFAYGAQASRLYRK